MAVYCPLPPQPWYRGFECHLGHGCVPFIPCRYRSCDRLVPSPNRYVRKLRLEHKHLHPENGKHRQALACSTIQISGVGTVFVHATWKERTLTDQKHNGDINEQACN